MVDIQPAHSARPPDTSLSVMKAFGAALPEGLHRGQMRKLGLTSK
jgi:hypothetical protein